VPKWGYSIIHLDPEKTVKASGRELRISHKHAIEICNTLKGMMLPQAKAFLQNVIEKKSVVPFKKYKKKLGHKHGLEKTYAGKYPVKAAKKILEVLNNAQANAEFKGMDTESLKIIHASSYPGRKIKKYTPRAMGRASPRFETLTHIELVLEQIEQPAEEI
jgi:large subunit ribosomal protein L22